MGGNPKRGSFEGVGPEIETFLGPEMATSAASARSLVLGEGARAVRYEFITYRFGGGWVGG